MNEVKLSFCKVSLSLSRRIDLMIVREASHCVPAKTRQNDPSYERERRRRRLCWGLRWLLQWRRIGSRREMTALRGCLCVGTLSRGSDGSLFPHFLMNTGIAESLLHAVHGLPKHLNAHRIEGNARRRHSPAFALCIRSLHSFTLSSYCSSIPISYMYQKLAILRTDTSFN